MKSSMPSSRTCSSRSCLGTRPCCRFAISASTASAVRPAMVIEEDEPWPSPLRLPGLPDDAIGGDGTAALPAGHWSRCDAVAMSPVLDPRDPTHPRPHLQRAGWRLLDGEWDVALDPDATHTHPRDVEFASTIVVPFAPETPASGVAYDGFLRRC